MKTKKENMCIEPCYKCEKQGQIKAYKKCLELIKEEQFKSPKLFWIESNLLEQEIEKEIEKLGN